MSGDVRTRLSEALDEAEVDVKDMGHVWRFGDQICGEAALRLVGMHRELIGAHDLAQADMDAKVRTFDNYGTGELIAATARRKALREEVVRAAAFWLGTPEVDR